MSAELVIRTVEDGIATLTLNRPEKLNALTAASFEELRAHLDALAGEDVRCLILTGAGRSFCAGHDLEALAGGDALASRHAEAETIAQLEAFAAPVIGKVRGHCFTGGLELALACDILVAGENAQFGDTHSQWGLVPLWGMSVRLPERVGMARAKELSFTARRFSGVEAADMGLVNHAVPDEGLDEFVAHLAAQISANSSGSNRIYKSLYANSRALGRAEALRAETDMPFGMPGDALERLTRR
ncbi:enoyl-CoA hydratase/isomerase family protein [Nocardia aurantiaca]|uniref:Enoyl-CoA hydratase/isomerase family protein n=1 Tax=Nocardia aurantiaca TaxID=2675850 RepID=A0A6I3KYE8_9NOCA|nr:enoyl-CoA hydratase/isomerase family protein [Nocardia aurantiaca]MTE13576.1 enoyl-CoA hydratase/isomerase family protein [Nocardia aurantiaca]